MNPGTLNLVITKGADYGPVRMTCFGESGSAFPLAGYTAYAQVRRHPGAAVIMDLEPVIAADDTDGLVTIPQLSHTATAALATGSFCWDLILETPGGYRLPPILAGSCTVAWPITQPEVTP